MRRCILTVSGCKMEVESRWLVRDCVEAVEALLLFPKQRSELQRPAHQLMFDQASGAFPGRACGDGAKSQCAAEAPDVHGMTQTGPP